MSPGARNTRGVDATREELFALYCELKD
jgi:hypothetical protein